MDKVFVDGWCITPLDDGSFLLNITYKNEKGEYSPKSDKFSFSTGAELLKFIKKNLLTSDTEETGEAVEAA